MVVAGGSIVVSSKHGGIGLVVGTVILLSYLQGKKKQASKV